MIDRLFSSNNYDAAKRMMDIAVMRQEALSSNIGNLETPGYKRVDLPKDFQAVFTQALKAAQVKSVGAPELIQDLDSPAQRKDGNNVVLQEELMTMNKNAAEYEALTDFVSGTMKTLRTAIVGHVQ
ncbi:MAG: flagellar basal body rod protein FlgB [Verrucomicrobiota bacterium]